MKCLTWPCIALIAVAFIIVAFGQPAWSPSLALFAATVGYALFWRAMLLLSQKKSRFILSTVWFAGIQLVQLSWMLSHPYSYIFGVWFLISLGIGAQFGLLSFLFDSKNLSVLQALRVASCWTLIEWSRLLLLSGFVFNPVGLALASHIYTLQLASFFGVYGLSFIVIFINQLVLKCWLEKSAYLPLGITLSCGILLGVGQHQYHQRKFADWEKNKDSDFICLLVQTAFPVEESMQFKSEQELYDFVTGEWQQILTITAKHYNSLIDLIALPELVVPFGTYTFVYDFEQVKKRIVDIFGKEVENKLPALKLPLALQRKQGDERKWFVNNAYFSQCLANIFDAHVVIGLEDVEDRGNIRNYYSSAMHFIPQNQWKEGVFEKQRYDKRILVPMGEYIPFTFCRNIAARYGITGSFTHGQEAKVWSCNNLKVGLSICYEEMFGQLVRESKKRGANCLLNITSDAWFPCSKLVRQHLEHARLRTVETGLPLVRACNTGITCVIDSIGRDVAVLGDSDEKRENLSDALLTHLPRYNYQTIYARFGDGPILLLSLFCICFCLLKSSQVTYYVSNIRIPPSKSGVCQ